MPFDAKRSILEYKESKRTIVGRMVLSYFSLEPRNCVLSTVPLNEIGKDEDVSALDLGVYGKEHRRLPNNQKWRHTMRVPLQRQVQCFIHGS